MIMKKTWRASASMLVLALAATGCHSMPTREEAKAPMGATAEAKMRTATTGKFEGAKANTGTATATLRDGMFVLTLSDDFQVPDTPAPHWQLVDSKGNTYLLQRLVIKEDKYNKTITAPSYVKDIAKVQIWCAYAEALLGEASFPMVVRPASLGAGRNG